jgi:hypothetical protein
MMSGTAIDWEAVYDRDQRLVTRTIANETFVVPVEGELADLQKLFVLEGVGRFIWDQLDGQRTLAEVKTAVTERFDVDDDTAAADCLAFIGELKEARLIAEKSK